MRRIAALALAAALLSGLAACSDERQPGPGPLPGPAKVDVDTPQLRELKRQAGVEPCRAVEAEPVDGGLPDLTLPCLGGGKEVNLASLRGPLVVNLWAVWCGPCRQEMPVLQAFHEEHGDRVPLLGIDYQDPQVEAAMELVVDTGVTYPLLADPQASLSAREPFPPLRGLPYLALVDEDGRVVWHDFTIVESTRQLEELVREHLEVDL